MSATVPHDLEAERAVIGAMLLFPGRDDEAVELLEPEDFYDTCCAEAFRILRTSDRRSRPMDVIALRDALASRDRHVTTEWLADVTTLAAASCRVHAETIAGFKARRDGLGVVAEAVKAFRGREDPLEVRDRTVEALQRLRSYLPAPPDDLSVIEDLLRQDVDQLDPWVIPGLMRRGWRCVFVAGEGIGKALCVDTPVLTTDGWTTMGAVEVGQSVFAPDGSPTPVVAVSNVLFEPTWRLVFDDGASVVAGERHLWETVDYHGRQKGRWVKRVRSTAEIAATLHARGGHTVNHAIACPTPPQLPERDLPVDPWVLGYWLGNGNSADGRLTAGGAGEDHDAEFVQRRLRAAGVTVGTVTSDPDRHTARVGTVGLAVALRRLGVLHDKHIPGGYLTASVDQRLALLQGLMDSDGHAQALPGQGRGKGSCHCELTLCSKQLAADAYALVLSLGIKATMTNTDAKLYGRITGTRWRICFQTDLPVFSLPRKAEAHASVPLRTRRSKTRYIVDAQRVPDVPLRCIEVDRADGMWLAGERLIPTHNSTLLRQFAVTASQGIHPLGLMEMPHTCRVLLVDLENSVQKLVRDVRKMQKLVPEWTSGTLRVWHRPQGVDIRTRHGRNELEAAIDAATPSLVLLSPAYKLYRKGRDSDEDAVAEVQQIIDDLRVRYGFATIIEHHAPHGNNGARDMRPFGTSWWLRWPELGFGFEPETPGDSTSLKISRWRGDRDTNSWPVAIEHGTGWPWVGRWADDRWRHEQEAMV